MVGMWICWGSINLGDNGNQPVPVTWPVYCWDLTFLVGRGAGYLRGERGVQWVSP